MTKFLLAAFLSTTLLVAATAKAAPVDQKMGSQFAGVSLGVSQPSGSNVNSIPLRMNYGLEYNFGLMTELSVGVFASRNDGEISYGSPVDFTMTRFGLDLRYSPFYDFFISLRGGAGLLEVSTRFLGATLAEDTTSYFIAPGAGIVFPITEHVQFVPSIHYNLFFKSDEMPSFQTFDAMGTLRYQF